MAGERVRERERARDRTIEVEHAAAAVDVGEKLEREIELAFADQRDCAVVVTEPAQEPGPAKRFARASENSRCAVDGSPAVSARWPGCAIRL